VGSTQNCSRQTDQSNCILPFWSKLRPWAVFFEQRGSRGGQGCVTAYHQSPANYSACSTDEAVFKPWIRRLVSWRHIKAANL